MICKVNYQTDPISLSIIAANGHEHALLDDAAKTGELVEVNIVKTQTKNIPQTPDTTPRMRMSSPDLCQCCGEKFLAWDEVLDPDVCGFCGTRR